MENFPEKNVYPWRWCGVLIGLRGPVAWRGLPSSRALPDVPAAARPSGESIPEASDAIWARGDGAAPQVVPRVLRGVTSS